MRRSVAGTLVATLLMAGCEQTGNTRAAGTAASSGAPTVDTAVAAAAGSGWREGNGPFLVVSGERANTGTMVFPGLGDTSALATPVAAVNQRSLMMVLVGRAGAIGRARLGDVIPPADSSCETWPLIRLVPLQAGSDSARWGVAFVEGAAQAVSLDSIEHLSRADSSRLVADLARIASGLPNDTIATFRGLPFNVRGAWLFPVTPGTDATVAEITRRVAQEANQREERLLIVAERDSGARRWTVAYSLRVAGTEETVDVLDVLAVARLGADARLSIVVGHESAHGAWFEILERMAPGQWRRQWRSPPSGC
jgi:hypothetical protein